ncbi:MAG: DsrE family protein [Holophagae bacterium]|nr:DsrE family protein [Holophagae bacterium]
MFLSFTQAASAGDDKLVVLWTSGDPEVAEKVCFMYTHNAKLQGWFDEVTLVVWGPSSKLLSENANLQKSVKAMIEDGIKVEACISCADMYGVVQELRDIGIDVKGMGVPLTDYLKSDAKILNF